jgi:hypothetical protein
MRLSEVASTVLSALRTISLNRMEAKQHEGHCRKNLSLLTSEVSSNRVATDAFVRPARAKPGGPSAPTWGITDPMLQQMQMVMFMKNLAMLGGVLVITQFGRGPWSLDARK